MSLYLTIGPVWLFVAATALLWVVMMTRPVPHSGAAYDFGGMLTALFHLTIAVVGTLAIWLSYFAARVFIGW